LAGTTTTPLTASSIVQTNASSQLTASNTLTGPTINNGTFTNSLTLSSGAIITMEETSNPNIILELYPLYTGIYSFTISNNGGNNWVITPGYKGSTATSGCVTYDALISGSSGGLHYFNGNAEVSGNLQVDGTTTLTGVTASSIVQTNGSSQLTASNTLTGVTLAGTIAGSPTFSGNPTFSGAITISNVANGTPGSHSAAAPAPAASSSSWFIPMDPHNTTNTIGSIVSPLPPRSVSINLKSVVVSTTASSLGLRVTTGNGVPVTTNTVYNSIGTAATTNGADSVTVQNGHTPQAYIFLFTQFTIPTTGFLTGHLDINWYIPASGNGYLTVTGIVGCFDGTNQDMQTIHGYYTDAFANVSAVTGVSLFLTTAGSPIFSTTACSADVIMHRL